MKKQITIFIISIILSILGTSYTQAQTASITLGTDLSVGATFNAKISGEVNTLTYKVLSKSSHYDSLHGITLWNIKVAVIGSYHIGKNILRIPGSITVYNGAMPVLDYDIKVVEIAPRAFKNGLNTVRSVILGEFIRTIGEGAFEETKSLREIDLSAATSLETIGNNAFKGSSVEFLNMITGSDQRGTIREIGDHAFENTNLRSVTFPFSLRTIGSYAFANILKKTITVKFAHDYSSLTTIGDYAFVNTKVSSIIIPASVVTIGVAAFKNSVSFDSATLGSQILEFKEKYRAWPSNTLPSQLKKIGDEAFAIDDDIIKGRAVVRVNGFFELPEGLEEIGRSAFSNSLRYKPQDLVIPASVRVMGEFAFSGYPIERLSFGSGTKLTKIPEGAFRQSKILTQVTIPSGLKEIKPNAFASSGTNAAFKLVYETPVTLETIDEKAFFASNIVDFKIPKSLTKIGKLAFRYCNELKTVEGLVEHGAGNDYRLSRIDTLAFADCEKLKLLVIPKSVRFIGRGAFHATALRDIVSYLDLRTDNLDLYKISKSMFAYGSLSLKNPEYRRLYVLKGTVPGYKAMAEPWIDFASGYGNLNDVDIKPDVLRDVPISNAVLIYKNDQYPNLNTERYVMEFDEATNGRKLDVIISKVYDGTLDFLFRPMSCNSDSARVRGSILPWDRDKIGTVIKKNYWLHPRQIGVKYTRKDVGNDIPLKITGYPPISNPPGFTFNFVGEITKRHLWMETKDLEVYIGGKIPLPVDNSHFSVRFVKKADCDFFAPGDYYLGTNIPGSGVVVGYDRPENFAPINATTPGKYRIAYAKGHKITSKNYDIEFVPTGFLTIKDQEQVTVATRPISKTYDGKPISKSELMKSIAVTPNIPIESVLSGISFGPAETAINAGLYNITPTANEIFDKYKVKLVGSKLTINPAPITIKPEDKSKYFDGEVLPAESYTYNVTGLVGADKEAAVISGVKEYTGPAVTATAIGTYNIDLKRNLTIKNSNYTLNYGLGKLRISDIGNPAVWVGTNSTDWNTVSNWKNNHKPDDKYAIRDEANEVALPLVSIAFDPNAVNDLHIPILGADKYIRLNNVSNTSSRSLVVSPKAAVVINGNLTGSSTINDAGKIHIKASATEPNGTFSYTGTNAVYGTVEMYSHGRTAAEKNVLDKDPTSPTHGQYIKSSHLWQFFGIPVESIMQTKGYNYSHMREYSEAQNNPNRWYEKWIQLTPYSTLHAFRGYEIAQESGKIYTVRGKLNTGTKTITLTADASKTATAAGVTDVRKKYYGIGQNLYGNSYTAAIDINELFKHNFEKNPKLEEQLEQTVYLYKTGSFENWQAGFTGTNPDNSHEQTTSVSAGEYLAIPYKSLQILQESLFLNRRIPSMQGFVLKYIIDNKNKPVAENVVTRRTLYPHVQLELTPVKYGRLKNKDMQLVAGKKDETPYIEIGLESKTTIDHLWLIENSKTTDGFDNGWDGEKSFGTNTAFIFRETKGGNMQIDASDRIVDRKIAFQSNGDSEYKLKVKKSNVDAKYAYLSLLDLETKEIIPLIDEVTEYSFKATPKQNARERFKIVNRREVTADDFINSDELLVAKYHKGVVSIINKTKTEGKLLVADLSGRLAYIAKVELGDSEKTLNLSKGVYILKVKAGKEDSEPLKIVVE